MTDAEMDKLSEAAAQPLEDRFARWFVDWLLRTSGVNGDVVHQVGAMLQEMYEIGHRAGTATISDIHGFTDVEKSMEMRAIDAESQADEFAAELDRMRADIKVYEARLRDRDNRVQELSLQVMDVERERDEARESLAGGRYNGMWMVLGCIGAWAHFEREQNRARDFFWKYDIMRSMIEAVEGLESDLAQRDRRIAELETALRMIASGNPASPGKWLSDVQMADIARAALSAPAQPATWKTCATCGYQGHCIYHDAAPPSPAAPLIVGRKVISEPGASIRLEVLELSEEAQRRLSVGKTAAANFLRASSPAAQCGRCNYMLTNDVVCTKCGWAVPSPAAREATGLAGIFGKWPGDETDEQIEAALKDDSAVISSSHSAVIEAQISDLRTALRNMDTDEGHVPAARIIVQHVIVALDAARSKETKR